MRGAPTPQLHVAVGFVHCAIDAHPIRRDDVRVYGSEEPPPSGDGFAACVVLSAGERLYLATGNVDFGCVRPVAVDAGSTVFVGDKDGTNPSYRLSPPGFHVTLPVSPESRPTIVSVPAPSFPAARRMMRISALVKYTPVPFCVCIHVCPPVTSIDSPMGLS